MASMRAPLRPFSANSAIAMVRMPAMVLAGSLVRVGFDTGALTCLAWLAVTISRSGLFVTMA